MNRRRIVVLVITVVTFAYREKRMRAAERDFPPTPLPVPRA